MSWAESLAAAAANLFSWPGILIPMAGTLLAMVASFLPGIGNTSIVVLVLAATMSWDVESVLLMFGALTGGATFMGSITAILFNIPGNVSSTAALFDGHPMARQGLPRTAIACAATASAVGSVFGVLVLLALMPMLRPLLLQFGPLERLLIGLWGLATVIALPTAGRLKSAAMTALGLLAAAVGTDPASGQARWTFGVFELSQGFAVVAVMLGMFTFSELIEWMRSWRLEAAAESVRLAGDSTRRGIRAVFRNLGLTLRCSSIGTVVGMIPGVGGTVAGLVAYGHAVQSSTDKSGFGKGDERGVIGPEAAVDAKDGGALLPAIAFGLPGSEGGVALLAVFAIHGLQPGLPLLTTQLPLTMTLILALLFSNVLTSAVGVAVTPWLARLRNLRLERIALPGLVISLVTVVQVNGQLFDLYTAVAFGVAGYFWRSHGWPRAPFIIAFVLGGLIETNLTLTVQLVELGRVAPMERGASVVLALMIVASVGWMLWQRSTPRPVEEPPEADFSLGAWTAAGAAALLAAALLGGGFSAYAIAVAAAACLLALSVAWRARAAGRPGAMTGWRRLVEGLAPPAGHRLAMGVMLVLPILVWLLGLPLGVACSVMLWYAPRAERTARAWLRVGLISLAYLAATYAFTEHAADLALPEGAAWQLLRSHG